MKHVKQLASILLAAALLISMATVALAAGTNTITVNNAEPGATYKIYKMMSLTNSGTNYAYKVESNWQEFFQAADAEKGITAGAGADYVTITDGYVTWNSGKDAANLAPLAVQYVNSNSTTVTAANTITAVKPTTGTCKVEFTGLDSGYYLITSTNGTKAIIASTPTNSSTAIEEKNANPTTDKEVQEDSTGAWGTANSAQIGDTVNFKATVTIRPGATNYVMHDVMDDGLTFDANSVKVWTTWTALGAEGNAELPSSNYTVTSTGLTDGCTFEVKFDDTYLTDITTDTTLTVTYTAVLNANAVPGTAELNKEQLTWGDKTTSTEETAWNKTETTTYQFEILKYANGDTSKKPLAGATFELYNNSHKDTDGNATLVKLVRVESEDTAATETTVGTVVYRVATPAEITAGTDVVTQFTTVADKKIVIKGVDLDTYHLKEITAPAGFNLPKDTFKQTATSNTLVWEIENKSGAELPSTGGMGTTLFYLLGSVLVVSAGVLLVTKRRMAK